MPDLVFIREIDPNTFLHFASRGESTCLRDYSRGALAPPVENRGYTASQINELLKQPGNQSERAPYHRATDHTFWHQVICDRNAWFCLSGNEGQNQFARLLDQFQAEVGTLVTVEGKPALRILLDQWVCNLKAIVEKPNGFNHWDVDDCSSYFTQAKGIDWTSKILEFCRQHKKLQWIHTGEQLLDFSLLSMELNLSISSKNNPIRQGTSDFIKPDGLGIRSDGTFCIIEIKAESDCPELYRATIQALCGAVATFAKREMITSLAKQAKGKRPAAASAIIPDDSPSLGLYIMVDTKNYRLPEDRGFRDSIRLLMEAFPPLREVVYFAVDPYSSDFPSKLPIKHILSRKMLD